MEHYKGLKNTIRGFGEYYITAIIWNPKEEYY